MRLQLVAKIVFLVIFLVFFHRIGNWLVDLVSFQLWPRHATTFSPLLVIALVAYMLILSIPFLPGIELGLMLMAMLGAPGIILVYLATVLALSFSFFFGKLIPPRVILRVLDWLHLKRVRELVEKLEPLAHEERFRLLAERAPTRLVTFLMRHRYLLVAALFNLPGNALIGGGGGVGLIVGMSRLFPFRKYLLLIALATTPGPIFFLLRAM